MTNARPGASAAADDGDRANVDGCLEDGKVPLIALSYEQSDSSALEIITSLNPEWAGDGNQIEFTRFTDGITNTLLKAINRREGLSDEELDREAVLLRAYGHGTDVLIDRHREMQNHELLMDVGLAPRLLARFNNGMLYRFIRGTVTHPDELRRPAIYTAVARKLAEWHVRVPCIPETTTNNTLLDGTSNRTGGHSGQNSLGVGRHAINRIAPGKPAPNVWTVMQKWIFALPIATEDQRARQATLQEELERLVSELSNRPGLGENGLVFAHCDLLSGNIIVLPRSGDEAEAKDMAQVAFIDYEYAVPSPAAFDIANHFAEWAGFECNFSVLPTKAQRRAFITQYIHAYHAAKGSPVPCDILKREIDGLMLEVDTFRGVPGFYWGIWALIQATISEIHFDYASYAELRLGEYWAWRGEVDGSREKEDRKIPLREKRWAQQDDSSGSSNGR